ncbi:MAG TPA: tetratricopeptide repeat protein [Rhizomicrobium sp.]|nr:tetratricopeptide repeat protein [Rhizomicrobium sp.]
MFDPITIGIFIINLALVYHVFRTGRSPMWLAALGLLSLSGFVVGGLAILANFALWAAYVFFAILPDMWTSAPARRLADNVVNAADPGRGYREKQRQVVMVGSADAKRALAEECIKMGRFADAVELYESAMAGPLGAQDPTLLKGLARAKMLSGEGAAAEALFLQLKQVDPNATDADAELDYARALALQGKTDAAMKQYESVVPRYPGEEARCRFALLLLELGQAQRAQQLFREVLDSVKGAPSYYRRRQAEWVKIAKQNLK